VTLGRQFVNWGVGYAWSPTDVFNPPDPTDPQGMRQGIDAVVLQVPVGPLDNWTLAAAGGRVGLRRRGNTGGTDWALTAVADAGDTVIGAEAKGDFGLGWHAALAHRMSGDGTAGHATDLLIGADYSWLYGDLVWTGEVLLTSHASGVGGMDAHTFQQFTYRIDDFSSISGSLLASLHAGTRWWNIAYQTVLSARSQLQVVLSLVTGAYGPGVPGESSRVRVRYGYAF